MCKCQERRTKCQHWLTLLSGIVESLLVTGVAFGWASLVFVLKVDGYFAGNCKNATREEDYAVYTDCSGQDEQLSQVMTVTSIANTILRFPIGYVFDRCGTRATRLMAISLYISGTLFISLSNAETPVLLYPALSCLTTAGTILYVTNVQVGNLFDSYRSTVITIYNGAYDSSAVVFFIIKLLHERGVSLHTSFLFLTLWSIILLLRTFFLMPTGHIPYPLPETYTYGVSCPGRRRGRGEEEENRIKMEEEINGNKKDKREKDETSSLPLSKIILHQPKEEEASFRSCVLSWLFLWHLLWVVTIIFSHFMFFASVNPTLNRLANHNQTLGEHLVAAEQSSQFCNDPAEDSKDLYRDYEQSVETQCQLNISQSRGHLTDDGCHVKKEAGGPASIL